MIIFISFLLLAALTFLLRRSCKTALGRNVSEWVLDISGLAVQGILIPILQVTLIYGLASFFASEAKGILEISWPNAFLLNFVLVDYLYYWNHRLLHCRGLWNTHAVHHTPRQVDVFITSRNTLWTPLLIVYVWTNGLSLFLLKDPSPFLLSASITAGFDLWRHTSFAPRPGSIAHRVIGSLLVTPNEHMWHHSSDQSGRNFGANLSLWDRLHGTYYSPDKRPERLGIPSGLDLKRQMIFPFRARKAGNPS